MLKDLRIAGYRSIRELKIPHLARVNLILGRNNSGKTSVLEAAEILGGGGNPNGFLRSLRRRGEEVLDAGDAEVSFRQIGIGYDLRRLFHGHNISEGSSIEVVGNALPGRRFASCTVFKAEIPVQNELPLTVSESGEDEGEGSWEIRFQGDQVGTPLSAVITSTGGLSSEIIRRKLGFVAALTDESPVHFIGTSDVTPHKLANLWDTVVLTPDEKDVVEGLRIIEPKIERIAFIGSERRNGRSAVLKLRQLPTPVPIGSMGEGTKRILTMLLHIVRSKGGMLLVDEIDTGLHYSVLQDLWKTMIAEAEKFGVQIFATTHSGDCLNALAEICANGQGGRESVMVHRIEAGETEAFTYDASEFDIAYRHHMELRG